MYLWKGYLWCSWNMPDCTEDEDTLCSGIFIFSPFFWMQDEKNSESMQARHTSWDVFTVQSQGSKSAPLVHLSVGAETWPFSSAELLSVKLSKNKFSTSDESYLFLLTLYFTYLFLSMLYFFPKGKKPGMYSLGRKDKREKLYCFGNDLAELLQASIVSHLSIAKTKLLTHVYRTISKFPFYT